MKITTPEEEQALELEKLKTEAKEVKPKESTKAKIPMGYTTVKLDSLGKLSAPFELHFRDYSIEEVLELASTNDDIDNLEVVVGVLNNMVFEDFNCEDLVLEELMEILYTIQGAFYSPEIEKRVIKDEKGDKNNRDNYVYASISLGDIDTKELAEEFQEPFTLTDSKTNQKLRFRLPRIKDKITAEHYLRDKYKKETRQFSDIYNKIQKIESNRNIEVRDKLMAELKETRFDEIQELKSYLIDKAKLMMILTQGLCLISIDDKELDYGDCEKLLEILPTISRRVWETYTNVAEKYTFGLDENVTFYLPDVEDTVTRRLAFQTMDFLPNNESQVDTGVSISFGS